MRPNQIRGNELYVRCIYCGDSKDHWKAHLSINLSTGQFHCFKCQQSGRVTPQVLFELQMTDYPALFAHSREKELLPTILAGPGTQRRSLLDRFHTPSGEDIFYSWWKDQHVGYYMRAPRMKKLWGFSGTCWYHAPVPQISSVENPLRFVEGPYDVLSPQDVCFFGIPNITKITQFYKEHYFVLVPDGDLWTAPAKFAILQSLIDQLIQKNFGFLGVEFLPQNLDPDSGHGKFISSEFFKDRLWKKQSLSSKAQQVLARALS